SARSPPASPSPTAAGPGARDCRTPRGGAPSTRSATPASSATGRAALSRAHHEPIAPAPTTTTRAGRSAGRAGKAVRWAAGVGAAEVSAVVAPPAGVRSVARSDDTCGPLGVVGTEPVALGVGD